MSTFVSVARVALDEMVRKHTRPSKFGFFMTEEGLEDMVTELVEFLETSRSLKAAGDKLLNQGATGGVISGENAGIQPKVDRR